MGHIAVKGTYASATIPGFSDTTGLSGTLTMKAGPRGFPMVGCAPPTKLPVLQLQTSYVRNAVVTPAKADAAHVPRLATARSLCHRSTTTHIVTSTNGCDCNWLARRLPGGTRTR